MVKNHGKNCSIQLLAVVIFFAN